MTKDVEKIILDGYLTQTRKEIAEKAGVSIASITNYMKILEIEFPRMRKIRESNKEFLNENNDFSSYFMGYVMADGWITGDRWPLIGIESKDEQIIRDLSEVTGCKVYRRKGRKYKKGVEQKSEGNSFTIHITGKPVTTLLEKSNGYKDFYSHVMQLSKDLQASFLRGFFDGDGCITHKSRESKGMRIQIIVARKSDEKTIRKILDNLDIYHTMSNFKGTNGPVPYINILRQKEIEKFKNWIYKDSTICLERKRDKFASGN